MVGGLSVWHYRYEAKITETLQSKGYSDIYQKKLLPITKLEKQLRKQKFNDLVGNQIYKPTLIPNHKPILLNQTQPSNLRSKNNMSQNTKVVTGVNIRFLYANIWELKSIKGGKEKYSVNA